MLCSSSIRTDHAGNAVVVSAVGLVEVVVALDEGVGVHTVQDVFTVASVVGLVQVLIVGTVVAHTAEFK